MTILAEHHPTVTESEPGEEGTKPFLDESMVRQVLFSERKKPVRTEPPKELTATKKLLKSLIMEAWKELQ